MDWDHGLSTVHDRAVDGIGSGSLGVTVAQRQHSSGSGFASSAFFGALSFSAAVGGLTGSAGVTQLGLPAIFVIPAAICLLTFAGLVGLNRRADGLDNRYARLPAGGRGRLRTRARGRGPIRALDR